MFQQERTIYRHITLVIWFLGFQTLCSRSQALVHAPKPTSLFAPVANHKIVVDLTFHSPILYQDQPFWDANMKKIQNSTAFAL